MPISSSEIAAQIGGYQSSAMNNLAYSSMLTQASPYGVGGRSDAMAGSIMNRGMAIGAPLGALGIGMLGLDPMSVGLKAGMGAFAGGAGIGGALAAGALAAAPVAAIGAGIQYAGSQMYSGAQQQMELNNTLRSSFNFQNRTTGSTGFSSGGMQQIGSLMREMTHQFGPGGETTSMSELTQLAGKMGQMGFATGVRDVQDFSKKFKEMVTSLKTMAKELNTTMEGAMEFAASAKTSGVFGMGRASGFSAAVRGATVSGGLALSEVTGAASIGSQISRSIGGLGRQGAMAGVNTINQIGTAQQMGLLSEEDIYNVTGMTGAEGRQAYAASSMQRTASFLRSGRGRRTLASLADKNGNLDEGNVQQLLDGGMSISETMRLDQKQLGKVGQANFIRNEGRLRGAALERIGGFLPAMQLSQWASSKGIDINDMDDRSMLFAQRQLGMGRDEVDQAVKMANGMPQILEQMRRSGENDSFAQKKAMINKNSGVEGIKQRFEQAKEMVNGKLQKVGQDLFNMGSEGIERALNGLVDSYVELSNKDIDDAYRSMKSGGAVGQGASRRAFGVGANLNQAMRGSGGSNIFSGSKGASFQEQFSRGSQGGAMASLSADAHSGFGLYNGEMANFLLYGQSEAGKMRASGMDLTGVNTRSEYDAKVASVERARHAASVFSANGHAAGLTNKWVSQAYAMDRVKGEGDERLASFGEQIAQNGDKVLKEQWANAKTPAEKAQLMANVEAANGIKGGAAIRSRYGMPENALGSAFQTGGYRTEGDANRAYARAFGVAEGKGGREAGKILSMLGANGLDALRAGAATFNGIRDARSGGDGLFRSFAKGARAGFDRLGGGTDTFGQSLVNRLSGTDDMMQKGGSYVRGEEFRNRAADLLSGDAKIAQSGVESLQNELKNSVADEHDPVRDIKKSMLAAGLYNLEIQKNGGKPLSDEQKRRLSDSTGMSIEAIQSAGQAMTAKVEDQWAKNRAAQAKLVRAQAEKARETLVSRGVYDAATGKLSSATMKKISKIGGGALEYAKIMEKAQAHDEGLTGSSEDFATSAGYAQDMSSRLAGMSTAEKKKFAAALEGGSSEVNRAAAMGAKYDALRGRGRDALSAANSILGAGMSKEDLRRFKGNASGGAAAIADRLGIEGAGREEVLKELSGALGGGKGASESLRRVAESGALRDAQERKKLQSQEAEDPLQAGIKRNSDQMVKLLEGVLKSSEAGKLVLEQIKNDAKSDPEAVKK